MWAPLAILLLVFLFLEHTMATVNVTRHPNRSVFRLILVCTVLFGMPFTGRVYAENANPVPGQTETVDATESKNGRNTENSLQYLLSRDEQLAKKNVDLQILMDKMAKPEALYEALKEVKVQVEDLDLQIKAVTIAPNFTTELLAAYETRLEKLSDRLERNSHVFQQDLTRLIQQHMEWSETLSQLNQEISSLEGGNTYKLFENDIVKMRKMSQSAVERITKRLQPLNEASNSADALRVKLYAMKSELRNTLSENRKGYFQQTSPPFYTSQFYAKLNITMLQGMATKTLAVLWQQALLIKNNLVHLGLLAMVTVVFWRSILFSRALIPASYRWSTINSYPFCSAIFLSSIGYAFLANYVLDISSDLGVFVYLLILVTLFFIRGTLNMELWFKKFFSRTLIFLAATIAVDTIDGPQTFFRLYIAASAIYGMFFSYGMSRSLKAQNTGFLSRILFQFTAFFLLVVLVATVSGYDQFSRYIFMAFMRSLAVGLGCWILFLYATGLFEFAVKKVPVAFFNRNSETVTGQMIPLFWVCYGLILLLALRQIWLLQPYTPDVLKEVLGLGLSLFSWKITLGFILTISAVLYGTYLISKWLQTLLLQDVMPRYRLERGVQLSISRIVHYAIFLIGFVTLLKILGLELTQLAILGGALGVGIGFGLQAIVNNFVSGLILLFERPVKVGDVVQVGQEWGEIKSLGLRATIVQTFDNAEIVIPNGDLITNQVTNWTLGERRVRLKLAVGVAYGTDIGQVLNILRACALDHPQVLTVPKPTALFLAFGASSLDFELRVWIPNIDDKLTVLSELNQEIDSEFRAAGIVIPFPQTDVHLHRLDQKMDGQAGLDHGAVGNLE